MPIIHLTEGLGDDEGAFTGQWFDTDAAQRSVGPPKNRGLPLRLWETQAGAFVLTKGTIGQPLSIRAVLVSSGRLAAILASWGSALPPALQTVYDANEV